ncbi:hypothetical protein BH09ACT8_BH09ACT8_22820 [soil metagenome]
MTVLRADTCAMLSGLDEAAKGRASIVRSCSDAHGLSSTDREALKDLLRCITEQRKRLRALRRLWQSLDAFERPSGDLVDATALCLHESRAMAAALEPWRAQTIVQMSQTVATTWARLIAVATQFTAEQEPVPARVPRNRMMSVSASH